MPTTSASYAQKDLVSNVEKNSYADELNITLVNGFKAEDVLKNTKEVVINGKSFDKSLFSKTGKIKSLLLTMVEKALKHLKLGTLMEIIQLYLKQMTVARVKYILLVIK